MVQETGIKEHIMYNTHLGQSANWCIMHENSDYVAIKIDLKPQMIPVGTCALHL